MFIIIKVAIVEIITSKSYVHTISKFYFEEMIEKLNFDLFA